MAHDVYISHARKDQKIAEAICEKLEFAEMRCCIAPRDISPGGDWTEATRKAIRSSRAMVLVFSENANAAPHIEREIAHAFYTGRTIVPFRLARTLPRRDFLFYLGDVRWFDAFGPNPEQHLEALTAHIKGLLLGRAVTSNPLRSHSANKRTLALNSLNCGKDEVRTSNHRSRQIFKRVAIGASIFAVVSLLWFALREIKHGASLEESNFASMSSGRSTSLDSPSQPRGGASAPTPHYVFTRFGLWEAVKDRPTPLVQSGPQDTVSTMPPGQSASATPSRVSDLDQNPGSDPSRDSASVKSVLEGPPPRGDRAAPIALSAKESTTPAIGASSPQNEPVTGGPQPAKLARINQSQAAVPLPTPSVAASVKSTPLEAEEHSLKELVLDYIRTVSNDDVSTQERFFAQRVNFYGEGVLSLRMVQASMQRYWREWPIRNWEPRGEPEFPKILHSTNPKVYEVLQPLAWSVSNGSRHKHGNTTLYVRIRKNDKGEFRIIQVEQRDPNVQSQNNL
jgi:TIR domain